MEKLKEEAVYSWDIVTITDQVEFKKESVHRLRYKLYGNTYTMLFDSCSDCREYIDKNYDSWMMNFHSKQTP